MQCFYNQQYQTPAHTWPLVISQGTVLNTVLYLLVSVNPASVAVGGKMGILVLLRNWPTAITLLFSRGPTKPSINKGHLFELQY